MNCVGGNRVRYRWYLENNSNNTQMDDVDINSYTTMASDGSLTVDVDAFLPVVTNESFAFVFRGMHACVSVSMSMFCIFWNGSLLKI